MIGSHDTFTYLKSEDWFTELISKFWKCQDLDLETQYQLGVRFFDIRVIRNKKPRLFKKIFGKKDNIQYWTIGHGSTELVDKEINKMFKFNTIEDVCEYFNKKYPDVYYRIYFESGNNEDKEEFKKQIIGLEMKYYQLCAYGIKIPWINLYYNLPAPIKAYNCTLFNWRPERSIWENLKHFKISKTPKKWAKNHNPKITKEMIEDKEHLYFFDFVGTYKNSED